MLKELSDNISEILKEFEFIADENSKQCIQHLHQEISRLDAMSYGLLSILLVALDHWGKRHEEVIWNHCEKKRASPSFIFIGLLANVLNSVLVVRRLIISGFDRQARTIFRELTEVADLLLAVLADENYLETYLGCPEDFEQARKFWNEHLKPWRIRDRIRTVVTTMGFDSIWDNPEEVWHSRWELYSWLSKSVHIDYGALVVESISSGYDELRNLNIGGRVGPHSEATCKKLGEYLFDLLALLALFLASKHQWTHKESDLYQTLQTICEILVGHSDSRDLNFTGDIMKNL